MSSNIIIIAHFNCMEKLCPYFTLKHCKSKEYLLEQVHLTFTIKALKHFNMSNQRTISIFIGMI